MQYKCSVYLDMDKESTIASEILKCIVDYTKKTQGLNPIKVEFVPKELSRSNHLEVLVEDYKNLESYKEKARKYDSLESAVKRMKEVWEK